MPFFKYIGGTVEVRSSRASLKKRDRGRGYRARGGARAAVAEGGGGDEEEVWSKKIEGEWWWGNKRLSTPQNSPFI
jgi:hypothetical protein